MRRQRVTAALMKTRKRKRQMKVRWKVRKRKKITIVMKIRTRTSAGTIGTTRKTSISPFKPASEIATRREARSSTATATGLTGFFYYTMGSPSATTSTTR